MLLQQVEDLPGVAEHPSLPVAAAVSVCLPGAVEQQVEVEAGPRQPSQCHATRGSTDAQQGAYTSFPN